MTDGYRISDKTSDMDVETIHNFLSTSYWAAGIPLDVVRKSIANSLCFGIFTDDGQQVGFARAITDHATFAYLSDVFIDEAHRGQGLSKWLLQTVHAHPSLIGLRRILLVTADAHGLYEQVGFKPLHAPERFMEKWQPGVYAKSQ